MQLVPFESNNLPAYLSGETEIRDINADVVRAAAFPVMSIKGKVFTTVKDGLRTVLTKPDDPDEVAQSIGVVLLRANMNAKSFYMKKYAGDDSEGARPDCFSYDGIAPSANAPSPQAKKCAVCPNNVFGQVITENGKKSKLCSDRGRVAISAPDKMEPMLLNLPPTSLKNLREAVKVVNQRSVGQMKLQYNMVVFKVGFDRDEASPLLTFKPVAILDDATYAAVNAMYDDEVVRAIVGADDVPHPDVAPQKAAVEVDELDAALAAKEATDKAKAKVADTKPDPTPEPEPEKPKATAKPKAETKPKAEPEAKPATKPASGGAANLLADLDSLLGNSDD